mmetsp:Transcript_89684/g.232507  ORF Transcript_89684/g.232507 Transcript_89684/m.232507 type:complete len:207 (-) Transcript_89684:1205-1825(-)
MVAARGRAAGPMAGHLVPPALSRLATLSGLPWVLPQAARQAVAVAVVPVAPVGALVSPRPRGTAEHPTRRRHWRPARAPLDLRMPTLPSAPPATPRRARRLRRICCAGSSAGRRVHGQAPPLATHRARPVSRLQRRPLDLTRSTSADRPGSPCRLAEGGRRAVAWGRASREASARCLHGRSTPPPQSPSAPPTLRASSTWAVTRLL